MKLTPRYAALLLLDLDRLGVLRLRAAACCVLRGLVGRVARRLFTLGVAVRVRVVASGLAEDGKRERGEGLVHGSLPI